MGRAGRAHLSLSRADNRREIAGRECRGRRPALSPLRLPRRLDLQCRQRPWSYRNPSWRKADKGRRLDHVWVSPSLAERLESFHVAKEVRGYKRPSDHAPLIFDLR